MSDADGARSNTLSTTFQVIALASMAAAVTSTGQGPYSLAVNNGNLLWLESGEDALKSVAIGGGTARILATRMVNPTSMAFAGSDVIWIDDRGTTGLPCLGVQVLKRTSASGATEVFASGAECSGLANIAIAGTTAYWVESDSSQQILHATPLGGGTTTTVTISPVPIQQIVASNGVLYWLEFGPAGKSMSAIRSIPAGGGTIATLLSGFDAGAGTLAVDSARVYYSTVAGANTVDLVAQPLAGGAPTTLVSSIPPPTKLISAGASVVWIDGAGQVRSVPVGGGSPLTLASVSAGSTGPFDVVFDGTNVVWTDATALGSVPRIGYVRAVAPAGGTVTTRYQSGDLPRQLAIDPALDLNFIDSGPRIARLDANNSPQTVAWGIGSHPANFVVSGESLIVPDGNRLRSIPSAGGLPTTLLVESLYGIGYVATDGTWLVWNSLEEGTLGKAPVAGGVVTELVQGDYSSAAGGPVQLASNGMAYWAIGTNPENPCFPNACVVRASIASPVVEQVAPGSVFAVDATGVYISSLDQIVRAPLTSGGAASPFVSSLSASELALDGASLYGIVSASSSKDCVLAGSIFKIPTAGGPIFCVIESDDGGGTGSLAFDSTYVYFTDSAHQDIRRTPK